MIKSKDALKIILNNSKPLGTEAIALTAALGRVLAENIYSDVNIPPFNRSAMDGFAINFKDKSKIFTVIEDIPAGKVPEKTISSGKCARIMTGAMLPQGADKVVMVENTKQISHNKMQIVKAEKKSNVSLQGEDVKKGELILKKGTKIRAQEAAMLASVGKPTVKVLRQPKVAIISTGSELAEPSQTPKPGQIRNSNSSMLLVQLKRLGIEGIYLGIAKDNFTATKQLVSKGLAQADILILSGGVSVGDYDFVREVLEACGVKILFNKVAIKPGKPTVFGKYGDKTVFGLPGNPVSVLIIFDLFVVPAIDKIVGRITKSKLTSLRLLKNFQRRNANREQYFPIQITKSGARPLKFHGSAHMQALTQADGIMHIAKGIKNLKKGTLVNVRPI
ncbi:MAG: molybdopterin molybdotransferase MoeA [Candidatus Margulisbacteria bacterium]|nr:molybdopterin molybdotransferase MoeA [Candidatus Margulisiibacteriota bacterium]MBU1022039.1 molybdopterin molybdotransferase MoeA [Candidatus Margulisiibacteriota bacterium]MBU1729634.1 molybdopterin molybdotransferase MoeA [Candidatus Margulisiibacteriota bacterium]MBU1954954.1 molybdopterin molybdotransferase MoeA [Candidatus Margulisiibacteriota bacterium]